MQQAKKKYVCMHYGEAKQFMLLNSHRRQDYQVNTNAGMVSIWKKMYLNLLTDSTVRDLEP